MKMVLVLLLERVKYAYCGCVIVCMCFYWVWDVSRAAISAELSTEHSYSTHCFFVPHSADQCPP